MNHKSDSNDTQAKTFRVKKKFPRKVKTNARSHVERY